MQTVVDFCEYYMYECRPVILIHHIPIYHSIIHCNMCSLSTNQFWLVRNDLYYVCNRPVTPVPSSPSQIIKMCRWWWVRWMSMPSLAHWSCISGSFRSPSSLMNCTPTSLGASVSSSLSSICPAVVEYDTLLLQLTMTMVYYTSTDHVTSSHVPLSLFPQQCLIALPRRAACWTCCCLCLSPIWSPSSSCWIIWRGAHSTPLHSTLTLIR